MSAPDGLRYCPDLFRPLRRRSREVMVGGVGVGGRNPIRVQSMITSDTRDTAACVREVLDLAGAGCEIVRITAQTRKYAENLEHIRDGVRAAGCEVPLVADIHFKPDAALEAAKWVEKVRVNPGNYADKKKFEVREYTDEQYAAELERIRGKFVPLVEMCRDLGRAMRIGTNHGSLSDRIMNRYGDTPLGMVESALEFVRIAREFDYHEIVFSMKASNPKVMIEAYRLLVARLDREGPDWNYPIHLGVTEAGDGEDGRIKSAIGIGSLLADGIGDTVRVSLTEDAVHEIPVARELVRRCGVPADDEAGPAGEDDEGGCGDSPQSVPAASRGEASIRRGTYLPHLECPGGVYAVAFRLADAVPSELVRAYRRDKQVHEERIARIVEEKGSSDRERQLRMARMDVAELYSEQIEAVLHEGRGDCWMRDPRIAELVAGALRYFDGQRYELFSWCVMPNHVHVVVAPIGRWKLEEILHSWKSFTSKGANRILDRSGQFWQKEYYDHLIRDDEDFENQVRYVLDNPGMGGLDDWAWVWSKWGGTWGEAAAGCRRHGLPQDAAATHRRSHGLRRVAAATSPAATPAWDPFSYERRKSGTVEVNGVAVGGEETVRVFTSRRKYDQVAHKIAAMGDFVPEVVVEDAGVRAIDPGDPEAVAEVNALVDPVVVTVADGVEMPVITAFRLLAARVDRRHPILLKDVLRPSLDPGRDFLATLLEASCHIGSLICDGIGDAILVQGEEAPGQSLRLAYNILQASGARIFKTDYVACPSCGRTLFNLQATTRKIREATGHLKGVRIAVMGCIVNGPGEMADADFGYVGGAPGKINLYVGKEAVEFNIPERDAVDRLVDLIRAHGKWTEPAGGRVETIGS